MNRDNLFSFYRFVLLIFLQSFILSNLNLFGFINPNLYVLFFIIHKFNSDRTLLIFLGFLMGLLVDLLTLGSGGHTISTLTIAFLRPIIIRTSFGLNYDVLININEGTLASQRYIYVLTTIMIHHFVLYVVIFFNFESSLTILKNTLFSSFFTFIMIMISLGLFKEQND